LASRSLEKWGRRREAGVILTSATCAISCRRRSATRSSSEWVECPTV